MIDYMGELEMQQIDSIVNELKSIMQSSDISQSQIISALDGKCSRNTIIAFLKGDADCKLSTLLMILEACKAELRIDTERSREAILSGDIASYRTDIENLRNELETAEASKKYFKERFDELVNKNTDLARIIDKQQATIDRYMNRMDDAEKALYAANADCRRKDARIVELSKLCDKW